MSEDLFGFNPPAEIPLPDGKKDKRIPLKDRIEAYFKLHKFSSFSTRQIINKFDDGRNDMKVDQYIRNALRKLLHENAIKATGAKEEFNLGERSRFFSTDLELLTLTLYKS